MSKLIDLEKNEEREVDTSALGIANWVKLNFGMWGFYKICKVKANCYHIYNKFEGDKLVYKVVK